MEINKDNAWDIINYYLSNEIDDFNNWCKKHNINDELPEDIDQALQFIRNLMRHDEILYKLLILKKELLTNVDGKNYLNNENMAY